MTAEENAAPQKSRLEIWLTFLSSFAWPITAVFVIFMFRGQLMELTGRVKTGEFAGAKFEFSEAAAGYISASVDGLAKERNPQKREKLAQNIRGVADVLSALHPRSLALLITGVKGCHRWSGMLTDEQPYFAKLESLGLVNIVEGKDQGGKFISLKYTQKGKDLLLGIGMSASDIHASDSCR